SPWTSPSVPRPPVSSPTQRMIGRNPIFQRHITEHPGLQLLIVSTHPRFLPQLPCGIAVVVQQPLREMISCFPNQRAPSCNGSCFVPVSSCSSCDQHL